MFRPKEEASRSWPLPLPFNHESEFWPRRNYSPLDTLPSLARSGENFFMHLSCKSGLRMRAGWRALRKVELADSNVFRNLAFNCYDVDGKNACRCHGLRHRLHPPIRPPDSAKRRPLVDAPSSESASTIALPTVQHVSIACPSIFTSRILVSSARVSISIDRSSRVLPLESHESIGLLRQLCEQILTNLVTVFLYRTIDRTHGTTASHMSSWFSLGAYHNFAAPHHSSTAS